MGVADAMPHTGLFKGRRDGPDFAGVTGDLCRNLVHDREARRVDAVVIGDENAHVPVPLKPL